MNTITTKDGTSIFYKDWGTGPTVVFSHGWPLNADAWDSQMLFLGQKGYRVIAHDRRGHGRSSQPWDGNDMDKYADDLGALLDQLNLKDVTLVGHSTGGGEVVRYIGRHGTERVAARAQCRTKTQRRTKKHRVRNIVLVHGAWADGSGWKGVYDILVKDGYNVSIVQEPETSFQDDVAATKRVLAQQDGPCILVAHSYGGAVITEAGTDPSVAGLVYVAAHMPDAGENEADDGKRFPSDLSKSTAIKKTA
jgi:pimeloyl-ACP methyl ester carboxylesterase